MSNFLKASRAKLRFSTTKGSLSIEQMWDLSLEELDFMAVSLEEAYENSKGKSFLTKKTKKDRTIKLQYDIVLEMLQTLVEERDAAYAASETKKHNAMIDDLIVSKETEKLSNMSIKQLEKLRK